jgi:hypothetical protein
MRGGATAIAVNIVFRFGSTLLFGVINNLKERIWWNALISHISLENSGFRNQEAIRRGVIWGDHAGKGNAGEFPRPPLAFAKLPPSLNTTQTQTVETTSKMAADPVADKSGFLCTYMSTHPDTLVAYVKHFGKVDGNVSSAKMLSIDSKVRSSPPHTHG